MAPNLYLYQLGYDRTDKIQRALPDALDLLTISVESGLGFDAALSQVARNTDGPLAEEFARVLQEMQIGLGRGAALRALGERTHVAELKGFVSAMVQADALGIPIAQVLRVQSREIRTKRRQRAEEQAQKVAIKILIPLIFCILPCLFIAVLGPAVIGIMDAFSGTLVTRRPGRPWAGCHSRRGSSASPRSWVWRSRSEDAHESRPSRLSILARRHRRRRPSRPTLTSRLPESWVALTEGALAALVIAFALPDGFVLLPYLVVPALLAGVSAGVWSVVAVVGAEIVRD